ncbi:hypothetical protein FOCC_FOCC013889 [Frankliniella occidentalis]|nr:hypothetical protein FOCC_FOCC013889 [Frankliniella occidentalis]
MPLDLAVLQINKKKKKKIGFDGSSNHSMYNQMWKDDLGFSDHDMVLAALVPLVLHQTNESAENVNILWMNQKASSTVHCHPLELEFTKETNPYIKNRSKELRGQSKFK